MTGRMNCLSASSFSRLAVCCVERAGVCMYVVCCSGGSDAGGGGGGCSKSESIQAYSNHNG